MWFLAKRVLLFLLAVSLPLQQVEAAAMACCPSEISPAQQATALPDANVSHADLTDPCHHGSTSAQDHPAADPHTHPTSVTHTNCPLCAGFSLNQMLPGMLAVPHIEHPVGRLTETIKRWHIQFLTSGPDRPPRNLSL